MSSCSSPRETYKTLEDRQNEISQILNESVKDFEDTIKFSIPDFNIRRGKWECDVMDGWGVRIAKLRKMRDRDFRVYVRGGCLQESMLGEALRIVSKLWIPF